jgi:hypothetical protein
LKKREKLAAAAEYLILDATEQPIQRPKKGQKKYYNLSSMSLIILSIT